MKRLAVCPGTFDPMTYGHIDLIRRSLKIFDTVIVAVAENLPKGPQFDLKERMDMVRDSFKGNKQIVVESFSGLVVDYALKRKAQALVRGVRMFSDFEYEFQMALTNRKLRPEIETIFMMPNESYAYLTSRLIKEIASMGGDVSPYVPAHVNRRLKKKYGR